MKERKRTVFDIQRKEDNREYIDERVEFVVISIQDQKHVFYKREKESENHSIISGNK